MAKLRVSTFNCENLFSRAKILNFDNKEAAGPLDQLAELNALIAQAAYAAADTTRIVQLIHALRDFLDINELREKLLIHHDNGTDEVRADVDGRADWVGGIRLTRSTIPTDAQKNTACSRFRPSPPTRTRPRIMRPSGRTSSSREARRGSRSLS